MNRLLEYDREVFLFLNRLGNSSWDGFWLFITDAYSSIPLYVLLLAAYLHKFGLKATLLTLVTVAIMITLTDQLANIFKYNVGRLRPCHEPDLLHKMRLVKAHCGGKFSFFSAHAASSAALATFFSQLLKPHYKIALPVLVIWSLLVAYSRIYIGVHYPLDCAAGILAGILIGRLISKAHNFLNNRLRLVPVLKGRK